MKNTLTFKLKQEKIQSTRDHYNANRPSLVTNQQPNSHMQRHTSKCNISTTNWPHANTTPSVTNQLKNRDQRQPCISLHQFLTVTG